MSLVAALLLVSYVVGAAWAAPRLLRSVMHDRHMAVHYLMGEPPGRWEYPFVMLVALLWPLPMLAYLVVDFLSLDDV